MKSPFFSPDASSYSYVCAFLAAIGSLLWGYDSGIFSTAQAQEYFTFQFDPDSATLGGIISVYTAGGALGCLLSGPIGNRWGRKRTMQIGAVIAIVGTSMQTAAFEVITLMFGRLIAGLAIGIIYFAIPMFQSEISPASHRGMFVGLHSQFIGFGYMLSNWVGYAISYAKGPITYRFPVGFQVVLALMLLGGTYFLPESPRWLMEKGKTEEAEKIIRSLRRQTVNSEVIAKEIVQMREQICWERENEESSLKAILQKPSYRKRLLLGCGVQIGQQICGISAINYYQTIMYRSLGIQGRLVLVLAGVWGLTGPLANIFCLVFIIDRVRRRTLFIAGSLAMTADIAIVQIFVAVFGGTDNQIANGFGIFFLILFGVLFSLSWNSGAPVYTTEIFPTQLRPIGGAISTFWSFVIQVVLAQASPTALENIGWRYYFFFIACNLVTALSVYFFLPETKGKSLEEISEVFGDTFVSIHMDEDLSKLSRTQVEHAGTMAEEEGIRSLSRA
ncbi:hypothetical protein QQX98_011890 [Neonectria punicea]|uniref:Major facilitator superfamily (MFS) profile domain-containing protein n=1 Tax=Neonectria punicea TaxID=979145 RepID=A0ABR1GKP0_9HYPO